VYVDPRGPRVGATITTAVLAAVLITGSGWLLAAQAVVFSIGALAGCDYAPYCCVYRNLVRPWLGEPAELEATAPLRFAQAVGFGFAAVGAAGYLAGITPLGIAATAMALTAAFLNAAFGFCLGCEMHLLITRALHRPLRQRFVPSQPQLHEGAAA
jgi:hypothetical protein